MRDRFVDRLLTLIRHLGRGRIHRIPIFKNLFLRVLYLVGQWAEDIVSIRAQDQVRSSTGLEMRGLVGDCVGDVMGRVR